MAEKLKIPTRTKHGLVVAPEAAKIKQAETRAPQQRCSFTNWHHLYFPKQVFLNKGPLAAEFRSHRFNMVKLPIVQHNRLHRRYQAAVDRNPNIFVPDDEVMATFLDEAYLLGDIQMCINAIANIDMALQEGVVKRFSRTEENRCQKLERIYEIVSRASNFELVRADIVDYEVEKAVDLLAA